jgi:predicted SAM-dependent methyltransferase
MSPQEREVTTKRSLKGRIARDYFPVLLAPFLRILTLPCSERTKMLVSFDFLRARARRRMPGRVVPAVERLHVGCGARRVPGFLNVDVAGSELDIDLASGELPFADSTFNAVVSQHVIEHLDLHGELLPLLRDIHRVMKPAGEIWLSCPDMNTVCRLYVDGRAQALVDDRRARWPSYSLNGTPAQHFVNDLFHQHGEHQNLFDFELVSWALRATGFRNVEQKTERDLLSRFPDFPVRNDDLQTLLVCATK